MGGLAGFSETLALAVNLPEVHVWLFEPVSALSTGDVPDERAMAQPERY